LRKSCYLLATVEQGCFFGFFLKTQGPKFQNSSHILAKTQGIFSKTQGFYPKLNFSENQNSINTPTSLTILASILHNRR